MKQILLAILALFVVNAATAQSCTPSFTTAMAPSGNNLLRLQLNNTTTPLIVSGKTTMFTVKWGDGFTSYVWTGNSYHNYASPGTYTVWLIQKVDDTVTKTITCWDSTSASVTVAYSPCATSFTTTVGANGLRTFTATTPAGATGMTYSWNFGDASTGTGSPVNHTYASNGTYTVTLTAVKTGTGACTYVNSANISVTNVIGCGSSVANFSSTQSGPNTYFSNTSTTVAGLSKQSNWDFGDGNTSAVMNPTHNYAASGTYNVCLINSWYDSVAKITTCIDTVCKNVTVSIPNLISGIIMQDSMGPHVDSAQYKVWLIVFNSSTNILSAVDSTVVTGNYWSNPVSYQFTGKAAGTYRTKAKMLNGPTTGAGYVPTYHLGYLMWNSATLINHTGLSSIGKNIKMQLGTVTTGPGFVGGNVSAGANKGTASGIEGMQIFLLDGSGNLVAGTETDANGDYSFSDLPPASYSVYPEQLDYATTPISVNVVTGSPVVTKIDFTRSVSQKSITPATNGIINTGNEGIKFGIYPNPAKDKVIIEWDGISTVKADIIVTDVTGKSVYHTTARTNGNTELSLGQFEKGLYFITISSGKAQSTQKIMLQ